MHYPVHSNLFLICAGIETVGCRPTVKAVVAICGVTETHASNFGVSEWSGENRGLEANEILLIQMKKHRRRGVSILRFCPKPLQGLFAQIVEEIWCCLASDKLLQRCIGEFGSYILLFNFSFLKN
ncbi:hypothetical protein CEXT_325261 [Caerostris extrusa]|uniref:Transposase n=1 Tax=Caerostris extrusa TaxID=172846 RepID=A0AAV4TSZ4_CAEEX|nr:hypothetical protein CEXT_325261 [Caerostris extrusa]